MPDMRDFATRWVGDVADVRHRYSELVFMVQGKALQRRLIDAAQIELTPNSEWDSDYSLPLDQWAGARLPTPENWNVELKEWNASYECLAALMGTGVTTSRRPYIGNVSDQPAYVEIRSLDTVLLRDGTMKDLRSVVPRCRLRYTHQTWHYQPTGRYRPDGTPITLPVLVHDVVLRVARTTDDLTGEPLEQVAAGGVLWYQDLYDRPRRVCKVYDVIELQEPDQEDLDGEGDNEGDDDSPDAVGPAALEPAGRGY